jgi:hypothetical protein
MKMKAVLLNVGEKKVFSSNFAKQEFLATNTEGGAYPNLPFELVGDDIQQLDGLQPGQLLEITYEIHGKSFVGRDGVPRNVVALRAYKVDPVQEKAVTPVVPK